jgi:hypothetical protein
MRKAVPRFVSGQGPTYFTVGLQRLFRQQRVGRKKVFYILRFGVFQAAPLSVTNHCGKRIRLKNREETTLISPGSGPNHQSSDELHTSP